MAPRGPVIGLKKPVFVVLRGSLSPMFRFSPLFGYYRGDSKIALM
jgi:hypothetical protein